ncbi:hypothetical protein [Butyrivibrio fibrisolvens]|uniref:hypothetical protein n=1 Tax=Butyrivibrio fibrisolvens TaxID=831 RepID=UPI00040EB27E|nr:hypothetical protein [Butyrivibrio fibrisolvens]
MIKKILSKVKIINYIYIKVKWREKNLSKGMEHADKQFYVIRRHSEAAGLMSFAMTNLGDIMWAASRGYTPVVDMMNYRNSLMPDSYVGKHNSWDDYFKQPFGFFMEDLNSVQNIHLGTIGIKSDFPDYPMLRNDSKIRMWRDLAHRYLKPRDEFIEEANRYYIDTFGNKNVLGVLARGTDYTNKRPKGHPIQPDIDQLLRKSKEFVDKHKCDYIYIATEDSQIYESFENEFPGMLFSYQKERYHIEGDGYLSDIINKVAGGNVNSDEELYKKIYERNRQYLVSLIILSKTDYLVAGATSGTYGALLFTEGYKDEYVFDEGVY